MNPYETLNVSKDATLEEIKSAYKKQAKKHHPDAGGDKEKFSEVSSAYALLSNPEKRAYYDEHGIEEEAQNSPRQMACAFLTQLFEGMIDAHGERIIKVDVIGELRRKSNSNLQAAEKEINNLEEEIAKHERCMDQLKKRFSKKNGGNSNMFMLFMEGRSRSANIAIKNLKTQYEIFKEAENILDEYEFQFDVEPPEDIHNRATFYSGGLGGIGSFGWGR